MNRDVLMESIDDIDTAMCELQATAQRRGVWSWPDKVIYNICRAVKLLLAEEARKGRTG